MGDIEELKSTLGNCERVRRKSYEQNEELIHNLEVNIQKLIVLTNYARTGFQDKNYLLTTFFEILNSMRNLIKNKKHYFAIRKWLHHELINLMDVIRNSIDMLNSEIRFLYSNPDRTLQIVKDLKKSVVKLGHHNFVLFTGIGLDRQEFLSRNRVLVSNVNTRSGSIWFTLDRKEAQIHAEISDYEFSMKTLMNELSPGSGEDVKKRGADEILMEAQGRGNYRGISYEKIKELEHISNKKKGFVYSLRNPDKFELERYTQEGEQEVYVVKVGSYGIPISELEAA